MLTPQQQSIIDIVIRGNHVSVIAMPGSGKSRVSYELIGQCTDNVLLLMYNRGLCDVTTEYIKSKSICVDRKVKAFTFHGVVSSLSGSDCHNDRQISYMLKNMKHEPTWPMSDFTLLIIDEVQDMRPDFIHIVHYLIESVCTSRDKLRIVLLGDPKQLLYDFYNHNRADTRFLTLGDIIFRPTNDRVWEKCTLTKSFRSTIPVTNFINALLPGHNMQSGGVHGPPVSMIVCDIYSETSAKLLLLTTMFDPEDIMVLCASLNRNSPVRHAVRTLVAHGVPVHVQRSGNIRELVPTTQENTTGCIRFKTFCSTKGLEAKLVVVYHVTYIPIQLGSVQYE